MEFNSIIQYYLKNSLPGKNCGGSQNIVLPQFLFPRSNGRCKLNSPIKPKESCILSDIILPNVLVTLQ